MRYIIFFLLISTLSFGQSGVKDYQIRSDTPYTTLQIMTNDTATASPTYKFGYWRPADDLTGLFSDRDLLRYRTATVPSNTDTTYHLGQLILGDSLLVKTGSALLQLSDSIGQYYSNIDLHTNNVSSYGMRFYSSDLTDGPVSYFNAWGSYYTRGWVVISAQHTGTGDGFQITHPSPESFMLGVNSDVGGPAVQIKGNAVPGGHILNVLDADGDHTFKIENDGKHWWGIDTLTNMDTDFFRDTIAGRLKTSGTLGFGTDIGNADKLAGMAGRYLTGVTVGNGLAVTFDTLKVDLSVTSDDDWYKSGGLTPDDITQDIYHEGDIHLGDPSMLGTAKLNVVGTASIWQTAALNNLFINGGNTTATGTDNVALQQTAGYSLTTGSANVLIGKESGRLITTGLRNIGLGGAALYSLTTGSDNLAIGTAALATLATTSENTAVGIRALNANTGAQNTGIGLQAGRLNTGNEGTFIGFNAGEGSSGNRNTLIGAYAGNLTTGGSIHLGYGAGYLSTTSDKLYIHNINGANEANEKLISIIYGEMNATTANQLLHFNSKVLPRYMGGTSTSIGGYDASGYLSTVGTSWGIDLISGNLVVDSSEVATQYDLTLAVGGSMMHWYLRGEDTAGEKEITDADTVTFLDAGIISVTRTNDTILITGTEVDGSITNELQTIANTSDATSHTATLSNSGGSIQYIEGAGITLTTGGTGLDGTVTIASTITDTDDQNLTIEGAGPTYDIAISDGTDVTIAGGGIVTLSETPANTLVITATEVDGSITNEIQTLDVSGTSQPITFDLSSDASDITLTGAGISVVSASGNAITITSTEVDGSTTNEAWTIDGDAGDTEVISNQTVLFDGTGIVTTTYTASSNTLTIAATEVDGSTTNELNTVEEANVSVQTGNSTLDFQTLFDVAADGAGEVNISLDLSEATTVTTPEADDYVIMHDAGSAVHQKILWSDLYDLVVAGGGDGNGIFTSANDGLDVGNTTFAVGVPGYLDFESGLLYISGSSGRVGINTNSPGADFHVSGAQGSAIFQPSAGGAEAYNLALKGQADGATTHMNQAIISLAYLDADYLSGAEQTAVTMTMKKQSDLLQHTTYEVVMPEATDATVFLSEKQAAFSDNTTESHISISGGFANPQNYEWTATPADLTIDRSYNIINVSGAGVIGDEINLPEVNSTSDNWDSALTSAQVQVGQEYTISNFRAATNLVVRVFTGDQINNGATTLTIAPGDSYIIKCVRFNTGVGYWKTYD